MQPQHSRKELSLVGGDFWCREASSPKWSEVGVDICAGPTAQRIVVRAETSLRIFLILVWPALVFGYC